MLIVIRRVGKDSTVKRGRWSPWVERITSAAVVVALVIGGIGLGAMNTAAARKRATPRLIQAFSNSSSVTINDNGATALTAIFVSGFETELADIDVTLTNLSHTQAADIDALLVGPAGQTALLISDVGSSGTNVTLTLDDGAANQVSSTAPLAIGSFQPTNFSSGDTFGPPAPASPASGSELGVFNSTDPNGTWNLFLRDDTSNGAGGMLAGGWSVRITSANGVPDAAPDSFQAQAGKPLNVDASGVLENDGDPDNDSLTAILAGQPKKGSVQLQVDGGFTYRSSKKAKGMDSFTYLSRDPSGLSDLETVTIQIKKAKKKGKK